MSFFVKDENVEEEEEENMELNNTFATYQFTVEPDGFRTIDPSQNHDDFVDSVKTWRTVMTSLDINYIEDGTNGMTSANYNSKQAAKRALEKKGPVETRKNAP